MPSRADFLTEEHGSPSRADILLTYGPTELVYLQIQTSYSDRASQLHFDRIIDLPFSSRSDQRQNARKYSIYNNTCLVVRIQGFMGSYPTSGVGEF